MHFQTNARAAKSRTTRKLSSRKPLGEMPKEPRCKVVDPSGYTDGIEAMDVRFMPHQKGLVEKMARTRSLLAWWHMGSGKTLGAIGSAIMLMETGAVSDVLIVAPKSMVGAWKGIVRSAFDPEKRKSVSVSTYGTSIVHQMQFAYGKREKPPTHFVSSRTFLIVDEAHNLKKKVRPANHDKLSCSSDALLHCARKAGRLLLLTGTPIVNGLTDLNNLAGALMGLPWNWTNWNFRSKKKHIKGYRAIEALKGRVDKFLPTPEEKVSKLAMPRQQNYIVELIMSDDFKKFYSQWEPKEKDEEEEDQEEQQVEFTSNIARISEAISCPPMKVEEEQEPKKVDVNNAVDVLQTNNAFYNRTRRAGNGRLEDGNEAPLSAKQEWLREKAREWVASEKKFIVYTAWKTMGAGLVVKAIEGIVERFQIIDGSVKADDRKAIVEMYNHNLIQCLIFTAAGAEGISLTETSCVVLFDTAWNGAKLEQALARGIRTHSHDAWPLEERVVQVYQLALRRNLRTPEEKEAILKAAKLDKALLQDLSADERLSRYVAEKVQYVEYAASVL
jgi:SNF2 family DNA or RNA helicase